VLVHVFTRHSPSCGQKDPGYKRCRCVRWVTYTVDGRQVRESTKTRSHEQAIAFARAVEERHTLNPVSPLPPVESVTIRKACQQYIEDKESQRLAESTLRKYRRRFKELPTWADAQGMTDLKALDVVKLRGWRDSWGLGASATSKKQEAVRAFFTFCQSSGWIVNNPARKLSRIKVSQKPTGYFTDSEWRPC
jgi:Phage integrase, N-terminal SAM-like domain